MTQEAEKNWTSTVEEYINRQALPNEAVEAIKNGKIKSLDGINLSKINLKRADLSGAELTFACLRGANLEWANFIGARLRRADLSLADLRWADLRSADLDSVDFRLADLSWADLRGTNLNGVNFRGAMLQGAKMDLDKIAGYAICPQEGAFEAWKAVEGRIIKLRIEKDTPRASSLVGRKCRAERVTVIEAPEGWKGVSRRNRLYTTYELGEVTVADKWDDDPRVECTNGIHFFMTRDEAENWACFSIRSWLP